jgi:transcription elongation factor Elf1
MKAVFTSTKVKYYSGLVDKYINVIYELTEKYDEMEDWELQGLIEDMESWQQGISEIELKINSLKPTIEEEETIKLY